MKSDFCYIVEGRIVAAQLDVMEMTSGVYPAGRTYMRYTPSPALEALLEPLAQYRTQLAQQRLDTLNGWWEDAAAGDDLAKKLVMLSRRPTARTVEPVPPQVIDICRGEWYRDKDLSICKHCGCAMIRIGGRHRHKFCSNTCADASAVEHVAARGKYDYYTPKTITPVACAHCAATFTPKRNDARYCSTRCRVAAHRVKT